MKLAAIADNPRSCLIAMERYVNDGSPSGFTFAYTTSPQTSPRVGAASFRLGVATPAEGVSVRDFGLLPVGLFSSNSAEQPIFVHPDMLDDPVFRALGNWRGDLSWFDVKPTASARTVWVASDTQNGYLKLHYERHVGRILRRISQRHALAAIETDALLAGLIDRRALPASFAYYRETAARVFQRQVAHEEVAWGMIWRPSDVYGVQSAQIRYLIPAFALFSRDSRNPSHDTILTQLGDIHASDRSRFLLDEILLPLVRSYFALMAQGGLQGEWHAQNVLFGFDAEWHCVATVLRDLESVDRDLPLMSRAGISTDLESYPYKCFDDESHTYAIRHSFMFDHKFGEYLLAPLIDHACGAWGLPKHVIDRQIAESVMSELKQLPHDVFPADGSWYKFENRLIDQSLIARPYVRLENPRFRF